MSQTLKPTFKPGIQSQLLIFTHSPEPGDPECICSFCLEFIEENETPLHLFNRVQNTEYRLHMPRCTDQVIDWGRTE